MTFPHPMDAEDTKAGFADEDTYDCDCCGKSTPRDQISRGWAYGIETFACEECWS